MNATRTVCATLILGITLGGIAMAQWKPVEGQLMTRWAKDVSPDNVWPEYPRPQMTRERWQNLNGLWDYAITPSTAETAPAVWEGRILVPFAIESALSGVKKAVQPNQTLWYRRAFTVPENLAEQRLLLHFNAVDWECTVFVNGTFCGRHQGGYDRFYLDITSALKPAGDQELIVAVWDPSDKGYQPHGKQILEPQGIWYTAVTGIWQTVWLEPVPRAHIKDLSMTPDIDKGVLRLTVATDGATPGDEVVAVAFDGGTKVVGAVGTPGAPFEIPIENAKLWSPDSPFLYDLTVSLMRGDNTLDEVNSYFGMRKIAVAKDENGVNRLFLNNNVLFQLGPLDQGWWPDGLYTAPTDEALRYDVETTRAMGFNMARKHVKIEPPRWYYHCDQLGLLVWQDMPSGDAYIGHEDPDIERVPQSAHNYYRELGELVRDFGNHPCIVMWVPFNEGWGQFQTSEITAWLKEIDPSRLVNQTSGWADRGGSDVHDKHSYPGPDMFPIEESRASVLGEFGGLGWPIQGHLWWDKRNWGYRNYQDREALARHYEQLIRKLRYLIHDGLAAAVYTQTTDVEGEVNGLMTYDREIVKLGVDWLKNVNSAAYLPPPELSVLAPTSEKEGLLWRYTTDDPGNGWEQPGYDASKWKEGPGVLGKKDTPGARVRTPWETPSIWARREFTIETLPDGDYYLDILHDEDAEVYINGVLAAKAEGYNGAYEQCLIPDAARAALKPGANLFAVHCTQTEGGQSIDVGLVVEKP
ncbi:MAG TPA: glycoside hydrolase family 2 TIM barrel-domain containing protein [Candidatus Hydrogenedentes bacterium]|nr:glycoside hydrolase family 2 TIM barrel-domain containing protein [Candidatus Hydrogenedentota bacterium]HQM49030.1 glycoside hydrolase family 2 TIM barrel-domain containing protein [Candidatus Hydrogenedentota bacterium]